MRAIDLLRADRRKRALLWLTECIIGWLTYALIVWLILLAYVSY